MKTDYALKPERGHESDPFLHLYLRLDDGDKSKIEKVGSNVDTILKGIEDDLMGDSFTENISLCPSRTRTRQ